MFATVVVQHARLVLDGKNLRWLLNIINSCISLGLSYLLLIVCCCNLLILNCKNWIGCHVDCCLFQGDPFYLGVKLL